MDFSRNNGQSLRINNYLEEFGLGKSWEKYEVDFTCCHEMNGVAHVCTIDHFFWNEAMTLWRMLESSIWSTINLTIALSIVFLTLMGLKL